MCDLTPTVSYSISGLSFCADCYECCNNWFPPQCFGNIFESITPTTGTLTRGTYNPPPDGEDTYCQYFGTATLVHKVYNLTPAYGAYGCGNPEALVATYNWSAGITLTYDNTGTLHSFYIDAGMLFCGANRIAVLFAATQTGQFSGSLVFTNNYTSSSECYEYIGAYKVAYGGTVTITIP